MLTATSWRRFRKRPKRRTQTVEDGAHSTSHAQLSHRHPLFTPRPLMSFTTHPHLQNVHQHLTNGHRHSYNNSHSPAQPTYTLSDPETRQISKQYFKLIQAIHHKEITDQAIITKSFPPGLTRQALTGFIKPPHPANARKLRYITKCNGCKDNMTILQTHYKSTITAVLNLPKNPLVLQTALGWARKRHGYRLTLLTIQTEQTSPNIGDIVCLQTHLRQ